MQTYIIQLIEDLSAAQNTTLTIGSTPPEESFEDYIAEVERYLSGENKKPIGEIIGMKEEYFPPASQLTKEQLNAVSDALLECLYSWNICIDNIPGEIPAALKYSLLTGILKEKIVPVSSGFTHIELCNYDSAFCPFGIDFCRCLDTEEDIQSN